MIIARAEKKNHTKHPGPGGWWIWWQIKEVARFFKNGKKRWLFLLPGKEEGPREGIPLGVARPPTNLGR